MKNPWLILLLILVIALVVAVLFLFLRSPASTEIESSTPAQAEPPDPSPNPTQTEPSAPQRLTPSEAQAVMASDASFVLLDVREASEFEEGHIPGAVLIPLNTLGERAPLEILDKDTQIIVYCRSGRRSAEAAQLLTELGFQHVFDLGGILDWPYEIIR